MNTGVRIHQKGLLHKGRRYRLCIMTATNYEDFEMYDKKKELDKLNQLAGYPNT